MSSGVHRRGGGAKGSGGESCGSVMDSQVGEGLMVLLHLGLPSIILKDGSLSWVGRVSWTVGPNDSAYVERKGFC